MLHHTNEVVAVAEAAESVEMTQTAVDEVQHERIPRRRKRGGSKAIFSTMNRRVKQANKYGEQ